VETLNTAKAYEANLEAAHLVIAELKQVVAKDKVSIRRDALLQMVQPVQIRALRDLLVGN
jgi:hypothetical protein